MFTGLYTSQMGGDFERPVRTPAPMLAEIFRDQGYMTGGFVANLQYTSRESGLARGFIHYDDYHFSSRQLLFHSWIAHMPLFRRLVGSRSVTDIIDALRHPKISFDFDTFPFRTYARRPAAEINAAFLGWQATTRGRPFFAFLNYYDAHAPYQAPPAFGARFALPTDRRHMGEYDASIAYIDQEIDRLLQELQRRGVLDNTIVIVTSDHGEQLGEHGLEGHANSLYLPLLRVPLVVRYPARVPGNARVKTPSTLRDLAATVIDLAGLTPFAHVPGTSLFAHREENDGLMNGSALVAEVERHVRPGPTTPLRFGPMRAVFDDEFHYIRRGDGHEELYAYRIDTAEERDLKGTPEG
jgi:arylsulfatase A-like enzyme